MAQILNTILPVFLLIALGQVLMRTRLATSDFFHTSDKLVYYIFFPALLFWKIGMAGPELSAPPGLILAVLSTITLTWALSIAWCVVRKVAPFQAGTLSQLSYRFNTYVGMAVVLSGFGEPGVAIFGIIISLAIPFINVLAVSTLVWYDQADYPLAKKLNLVLKALIANPLIIGCLAGLAWAQWGPPLPGFIDSSLALLSALTLPLALLSIGSSLSLKKLPGRLEPTLISCIIKHLAMPLIGLALLTIMGVGQLALAVAMLYFCLPTTTNAYILSAQMNSDADLASASIVVSTLLSFVSMSLALIWFGGAG